jgi:DNA-binding GntR family transcriptional regulator
MTYSNEGGLLLMPQKPIFQAVSLPVVPSTSRDRERRYLNVAEALAEEIVSGRWPVGTQIPNETELSAFYGLSRYAVRQCVEVLIKQGLVSRQQGIGTKVIGNTPQYRFNLAIGGPQDIARYAEGTHFAILGKEKVRPDPELAELFNGHQDEKWLCIRGLRSSKEDSTPISLAEIYVAERYEKLLKIGKTLNTPVYSLIEQQYGIKANRIEQRIFATLISESASSLLLARPGAAALRVIRSYYQDRDLFEVTVSLHPADRFSYSMSFELDDTRA